MSTLKSLANPLKELATYGQSVWLDYIRRSLITSGELKRLVDEDGLRGVTSNPSIFEKAIAGSSDYAEEIKRLTGERGYTPGAIYERLAVSDIRAAADILGPVYKATHYRDGYVSLEVSPLLANDTAGTIREARRLWNELERDNVLIKVPATEAGIPAIRELISSGINVNVTLLFSLETYERVAEAYIAGVEKLLDSGGDASKIASVASFFISRIDTAVDALLTGRLEKATDDKERAALKALLGKTAIANAKLTYRRYEEIYRSERWQALAKKGAHSQRLLWASTSTKNPAYRDTVYVEELIGADTVNTMPPATLDAFREHGHLRASLTEDLEEAELVINALAKYGISMKEVTAKLVEDGVRLFAEPFEKLLHTIEKQCGCGVKIAIDRLKYKLPDELDLRVRATLDDWERQGKVRRLWARDASLWSEEDEARWLDWLTITDDQLANLDHLGAISAEVRQCGFTHALLLGMGGSSLAPEVLRMTFGKIDGYPELSVLDSTDPQQVKAREKAVDLGNTLFIVSSKSGTTLEPNIFMQYFIDLVAKTKGKEAVGSQFIAITDPGSQLEQVAESQHFRHRFYGVPGIGGRYSALSNFGMVPAAILGLDVREFLETAHEMVHACAPTVPVSQNPGVVLGTVLGVSARSGRDKVTLVASPRIAGLGAWLEQLLAESTGKQGRGLIPVDREQLGAPNVYGNDRLFVYLRLESNPDASQDRAVELLEKAGQPVVRIAVPEVRHLGQEFFRWEIATAVAGSIIGINAFNQPDVEASKVATRNLTGEYEKTGRLPEELPIFEDKGIKLFTDPGNASYFDKTVGKDRSLSAYLRAHLERLEPGDYFALLAYVEMSKDHEEALQDIRLHVRDTRRVATCLGFGPRFLHSTGQAYKGGPNSGVFLQITCDDAADLPVPGQKYTFGVVKAAQARGDFQVLAERGRRALRVHLGQDVKAGLSDLHAAVVEAL